jgi:hypothetical protein
MMIWIPKTKSLLPSLFKREELPSLAIFSLPHRQARGATCLREAPPCGAKAGGRFSNAYVDSILRPLITAILKIFSSPS